MIGRADIEGSKSNVAMYAWLPQASYPCANKTDPYEISIFIEFTLGDLYYHLIDVPSQPNSPPNYVFRTDQLPKEATLNQKLI